MALMAYRGEAYGLRRHDSRGVSRALLTDAPSRATVKARFGPQISGWTRYSTLPGPPLFT